MVIDRVAPNANSNRDISGVDAAKTHAGANDYFTTESELVYKVVFTEPVNNVSADDFTGRGGTWASNLFIKSLTPIGTDSKEFTIVVAGSDVDTINSAAGQGVGVEFTGSNNIIDASGNELVSTAPAVTQLYVVDNAAPVFTSAATANINEDIAADSVAYDANTTDVAGGVVYTLKEVGDHADFSINGTTGVVTIDASPDHEAKETYTFTVQATDRFGFQSEKAVTLTINDLNEMPNIAITPTNTDFVFNEDNAAGDGSGAVSINTSIVLSDEDNSGASSANDRIDSATVKITNGKTGDVLELSGSHANVDPSYNASNFTLTLTAKNSYTIAEMQAAINAVKYKNTTDEPFEGSRTIQYFVNDGELQSNEALETIIVDPTNDTPVVTAASSANTFTEREGPSDTSVAFGTNAIVVDSGITVTNRDDTQEGDIVSAVVEILNAKTGDELVYVNTAGITKDNQFNYY